MQTKKYVNSESNMTDTSRKDGRWDKLSLAQIYNSIKYMFCFGVSEGGTRKKKGLSNLVVKHLLEYE